jgi:hypothetical protein
MLPISCGFSVRLHKTALLANLRAGIFFKEHILQQLLGNGTPG